MRRHRGGAAGPRVWAAGAAAWAWLAASNARALSESAGAVSAPILQVPVGARATGMGTAFTAVADDVSTLYYNPAGLTALSQREASTMFLAGPVSENTQYLAAASPLPFTGLSGSGYATLGASVLLAQNGDITVNALNPDGLSAGGQTVSAGGDTVVTVGYAERIADTPFEASDSTEHFDHFFGVSGKYIRSTLPQSYSAQTYAADVGYLGRAPELGLSLGAAIVNLGGSMRYVDSGDPLPLALRLGGAYRFALFEPHALQWSLDGQYEYYERLWFVNTGVEYTFLKQFAMRLGYQAHRELAGLTVGFGARWRNWGLDYAWAMNSAFGDAHRVGFTFRFGAVAARERERPRRPFMDRVPEEESLPEIERRKPETYDPPPRPAPRANELQGAPGWIY